MSEKLVLIYSSVKQPYYNNVVSQVCKVYRRLMTTIDTISPFSAATRFFAIFHKYDGAQQGHIKLKKPKQLQEILDVARELLEGSPDHPEVVKKRAKLEQLRNVLEM